jgi:phosphonate transport system substrate-binding protein
MASTLTHDQGMKSVHNFSRRVMPSMIAAAACALAAGAKLAVADSTGATQVAARNQTIIVGKVSEDPKKTFPQIEAMAGYLADRLESGGIQAGAAVVARNNEEMIHLLIQGEVDVVSETPFSAVDFATRAGAEILLWEWKNGLDFYNTIIFVPKNSAIESLADLRGKTIAFEDSGSTSGFLMPLSALRQHGLKTAEMSGDAKPAADTLGYIFAGDEVNIEVLVQRGIVDAGVSNSEDWEDFLKEAGASAEDFTILYRGQPVMRSALLVRPGMDPALKARIVDILLKAGDDPAAKDVLKKYNKVKKYEMVAGEAAKSLEAVRGLYPLVAAEIQ